MDHIILAWADLVAFRFNDGPLFDYNWEDDEKNGDVNKDWNEKDYKSDYVHLFPYFCITKRGHK
jgi:hypothetical protein